MIPFPESGRRRASIVLSAGPPVYHATKHTSTRLIRRDEAYRLCRRRRCLGPRVQCTDAVLPGLLDADSEFGWAASPPMNLPRASGMIESATPVNLEIRARKPELIQAAVERRIGALRSTETIYTGSAAALQMLT